MKKVYGTRTTIFVYNAMGQLIAEYGGEPVRNGVSYLTQDHLGNTRLVTDRSGGSRSRHDYLPFGEEISLSDVTNSERTYDYKVGDTIQKFTGKERDYETGLDYFGARYYTSTQGRFTSVDPVLIKSFRLVDPQRINLYVYGRNNPLKYLDPDGKDIVMGTQDKSEQKVIRQALVEMAKSKSGRDFLTKLDNLKVVFALTLGKARDKKGNENYGVTRIPIEQVEQIVGKGEQATGTITIEINPELIKQDAKANEKVKEQNKISEELRKRGFPEVPPKNLPYPDAPQGNSDESRNAETLGHELKHGEKWVYNGNGGSETAATNESRQMLEDPNKAEGDSKKFVEQIIQPKPPQ